jgi:hypothetical protein
MQLKAKNLSEVKVPLLRVKSPAGWHGTRKRSNCLEKTESEGHYPRSELSPLSSVAIDAGSAN